mmetsp:Transcript_52519/g.162996  ORF Transcript_52519/g.162996 Transcript_52519/m.162996 type:complete len:200 (-) Transcript_52519:255-854(-)
MKVVRYPDSSANPLISLGSRGSMCGLGKSCASRSPAYLIASSSSSKKTTVLISFPSFARTCSVYIPSLSDRGLKMSTKILLSFSQLSSRSGRENLSSPKKFSPNPNAELVICLAELAPLPSTGLLVNAVGSGWRAASAGVSLPLPLSTRAGLNASACGSQRRKAKKRARLALSFFMAIRMTRLLMSGRSSFHNHPATGV